MGISCTVTFQAGFLSALLKEMNCQQHRFTGHWRTCLRTLQQITDVFRVKHFLWSFYLSDSVVGLQGHCGICPSCGPLHWATTAWVAALVLWQICRTCRSNSAPGEFLALHPIEQWKKHPGWLGYIGDYTIQLCRDYFRLYAREPRKPRSSHSATQPLLRVAEWPQSLLRVAEWLSGWPPVTLKSGWAAEWLAPSNP